MTNIKLKNNKLSATISTTGATVVQMTQGGKNLLIPVSDPGNDPKFPNAIMAPFVNRVEDGKYSFEDQDLQLEINQQEEGHALHGLVYNRKFTVVEQSDDSVTLSNIISNTEFAGYPFDLEFTVTCTLNEDGLDIITEAKNIGGNNLPYSTGWHPYFLPMSSESVNDCEVNSPFTKIADQKSDRALIPNMEFSANNMNGNIKDTFYDNAYAYPENAANGQYVTTFDKYDIYQDETMKSLQIYTPDTRTEIAIEPQTTIPNAFNNGFELSVIQPGESQKNNFGFRIIS